MKPRAYEAPRTGATASFHGREGGPLASPMKLAVLFWIYKDSALCAARARWLRTLNPDTPIYVLYGGDLSEAALFERDLAPWVDDFYAFPEPWDPARKWKEGDLLIADWHRHRGSRLEWDSIFVAQWDLLLLAPLAQLCANLRKDEVLLSGLRPVREVSDWWWWLRPGSPEATEYQRFLCALGEARPLEPLCCNFVAAALPRRFLDAYAKLPTSGPGFLEYKLPIYAQIWGYRFCRDHPFNLVWRAEPRRLALLAGLDTLHAEKRPIPLPIVLINSLLPWGARVFHPYHGAWPAKFRFPADRSAIRGGVRESPRRAAA